MLISAIALGELYCQCQIGCYRANFFAGRSYRCDNDGLGASLGDRQYDLKLQIGGRARLTIVAKTNPD